MIEILDVEKFKKNPRYYLINQAWFLINC
jgi:hypothetical protein